MAYILNYFDIIFLYYTVGGVKSLRISYKLGPLTFSYIRLTITKSGCKCHISLNQKILMKRQLTN